MHRSSTRRARARSTILFAAVSPLALAACFAPAPEADEGSDTGVSAIAATAEETVKLTSVNSGLVLDVVDSSTKPGGLVQQWGAWTGKNQQWKLTDAGSGTFAILNVNSGLCLDVLNLRKDDGAPIQQWNCSGNTNQKWRFADAGSGSYTIVNVNSGRCLDVTAVSKSEGARLQQWGCNGNANQRFTLSRVGGLSESVSGACTGAVAGGGDLSDKISVPLTGWAARSKKVAVISLHNHVAEPSFTVTAGGKTVLSGKATYRGSRWGLERYTADLSSLTAPGGYTLSAGGVAPTCFEVSDDVFAKIRGPGEGASVAASLRSAFGFSRCFHAHCAEATTQPDDINLPLTTVDASGAEHSVAGTSVDLEGGWADATSSDKETMNEAKALSNLALAAEGARGQADKAALLDEVRWGLAYLLKLQNKDGSFPIAIKPYDDWNPKSLPRHLIVSVDVGVVAKCAAALAAASGALRPTDAARADQAIAAARHAWDYVTSHVDAFLPGDAYPGYWRGDAGTLVGAAGELARQTGEARYKQFADERLLQGNFKGGIWSKESGSFPGQRGWVGDEGSNTIISLLRYYPVASPSIQGRIRTVSKSFLDYWQAQRDPAYGMADSLIVSWFGGNGALIMSAQAMLLMGQVLGDANATAYGSAEYDWVVGNNPFGASFIPGFGRKLGAKPFARSESDSVGAVLPGMVEKDGTLSLVAPNPSQTWAIGEATIDSTSSLAHTLVLLQNLVGR